MKLHYEIVLSGADALICAGIVAAVIAVALWARWR